MIAVFCVLAIVRLPFVPFIWMFERPDGYLPINAGSLDMTE